ncbi:MAG: NADH-quinone oxidoreductase subunit F [Chitinophagia bacterium]|nr:NADH-quinone oxidoreductase subunit F [Chitinophagia bacterium]
MKTALIIGATGLTGMALTTQLLNDSRFEKVRIFVRRTTGIIHPKLVEHVVDFDRPDEWKKNLNGDVLYSVMGTTLRKAGSKEAQYRVDYIYQYNTARYAAANGVPMYVLVSAGGANSESPIYYSRIKGELEREIRKLPFETIHIIRPGMLTGNRAEKRTGEKIGIGIMNVLGSLPGLSVLKPIDVATVAHAMINATFRRVAGIHIYSVGEVFKLAGVA